MVSKANIVLAEDNPADVALVREALDEHEVVHTLHLLTDGGEVIEYLRKMDSDSRLPCPDVFLLDMYLPKQDGETILRQLRSSERCGRTPVVILTASDAPRDHESAKRHAALHYFRKTPNLNEFLHIGGVVKQILFGGYPKSTDRYDGK